MQDPKDLEDQRTYWLDQYNHYAGIEPANTYDCFVGMNAGESAEACLEELEKVEVKYDLRETT